MKNTTINANRTEIRVYGDIVDENAYICLTDIAKVKEGADQKMIISNWMSSYSTIDFLALWEKLHNPGFNLLEFQEVRYASGRFFMSPSQWIEKMNAIGITSKALKYLFFVLINIPYRVGLCT